MFDAGSSLHGLQLAARRGLFSHIELPASSNYSMAGHVLRNVIKRTFVGHAHFDHISGLVVASPEDARGKQV
jgi:3',5'-cyclic-nucleotide phosphodiesterase